MSEIRRDAKIIQFSAAARASRRRQKPIVSGGTGFMSRVELEQEPERQFRDKGELTVTCQNKRLREARRDVWREADTMRGYWKARLEMLEAIARAQIHDLPEGNNHPPHDPDERWPLLANWREAIAQQLLTPAPDLAAITWKRGQLAAGGFGHVPVAAERVEQAIAADVAFLAAHPTRRR
jgi:hypothetical protein